MMTPFLASPHHDSNRSRDRPDCSIDGVASTTHGPDVVQAGRVRKVVDVVEHERVRLLESRLHVAVEDVDVRLIHRHRPLRANADAWYMGTPRSSGCFTQ